VRYRLQAPAGAFILEEDRVEVDVSAFVRRLILFDQYILDSTRLREIPALVSVLGSSGLMTLLNSGALRIQLDATTLAQSGNAALDGPVLPNGSYRLTRLSTDQDAYISHGLEKVKTIGGMELKQMIKLKRTIVDSLVSVPETLGFDSLKAARIDLARPELSKPVVARALKELAAVDVPPSEITIRFEPIDETAFHLESNLSRFGIDADMSHRVLERAALALAGLNFRIEEMRTFEALNGVLDDDVGMLASKYDVLLREMSPASQEGRFSRVLNVAGVPELPPDGHVFIDADKLLELRASTECSECREWLQRVDSLDDREIAERVASLNAKVGSFLQSSSGKAVRFLIVSAVGLTFAAPAVGFAASAIDAFLIDRVFRQNGPAAVINRLYPSIFPATM
jgi:hypothetical protein